VERCLPEENQEITRDCNVAPRTLKNKNLEEERKDCKKKKDKAIPVTGRGGPYDCEALRFLHFLDYHFTDGGEIISLTRRPPFTARQIPGTHFC
jgi:hypothetical protein